MDPPLFPPVRQWFRGVNAEKVQFWNMVLMTEFRKGKPLVRKFVGAVSHIFPAEYTKFKHLLWGQFRLEVGVEVFPHRFGQEVDVIRLHQIIDAYAGLLYRSLP